MRKVLFSAFRTLSKNNLDQDEIRMKILNDASLKAFNTFGIEESCKDLVLIESLADVELVRERYRNAVQEGKFVLLGGGADVLILKSLQVPVFCARLSGIEVEREDGDSVYVRAAAGEHWDSFVRRTLEQGYFGLENLARIPGTVGGAPIQNIGAYGVEVGNLIESVRTVDLKDGSVRDLSGKECQFGYRNSIFKINKNKCLLIVSVLFKLTRKWEANLRYDGLSELVREQKSLTAQTVYDRVTEIRKRKIPDPELLGNAGSFFKNPIISLEKRDLLLSRYPKMPFHLTGTDSVKVPAAWFLDQAGWKGRRVGQVGAYERNPLIIVNFGGASGREILSFATAMLNDVFEKFGVRLEFEVVKIE
jgi:UDP-N-acetylmuramate dehydrogenase